VLRLGGMTVGRISRSLDSSVRDESPLDAGKKIKENGVGWLKQELRRAEACLLSNPEKALRMVEHLRRVLRDRLPDLKVTDDGSENLDRVLATMAATAKTRLKLVEAEKHLATMKAVGHDNMSGSDYGKDLETLRHESAAIKMLIADIVRTTRSLESRLGADWGLEMRNEAWLMDDARVFEYQAALGRLRNKRLELLSDIYSWESKGDTASPIHASVACKVVGSTFVYQVVVTNTSETVITDVWASIAAYPRDCMKLESPLGVSAVRVLPGEQEVFTFVLRPTKDCVEGRVDCLVSFIDPTNKLRVVQTPSYVIRSVCDLLRPLKPTEDLTELQLRDLVSRSQTLQLHWNANVLLEKAATVLPRLNLFVVDRSREVIGSRVIGRVRGFAVGKYTGKRVIVTLDIMGDADGDTCEVKVEVHGDDEAMLPTTAQEISETIDSWSCLHCGASLNLEEVANLGKSGGIVCRYCGHTLTLELYCRNNTDVKPARVISETSENEQFLQPPSMDHSVHTPSGLDDVTAGIEVARGSALVGGSFEFKVKVSNKSKFVITDVLVTIVSYPRDTLQLEATQSRSVPRIESGGFQSLRFVLTPTQDCVKGEIVSLVSFVDLRGNVHALPVRPLLIESVCDLLTPLETSASDFEDFLAHWDESTQDYEFDWNARTAFERARLLLPLRNFFVVDSEEQIGTDHYIGTIRGIAKGKYSDSRIAAVITIVGNPKAHRCSVRVRVLGENAGMFPTTIAELSSSIDSWTCPYCGAVLRNDTVVLLKSRGMARCDHCGSAISTSSVVSGGGE